MYCFFSQLIRIHSLVVKLLQRVWRHGFNSWWVLRLSAALCILRGTESVCALTRALWYCCALYNFFFLGFRQWRSCADRVANLNTTIRLPLFWRTWTWGRASTRPHVRARHMGRDYSYCRASALTDSKVSGFIYSWILENTGKTKASWETFLRLMPKTVFFMI